MEQVAGLQGKQIRSIKYVSPEEIWVTTEGEGFYLLKKDKVTRFPMDNGNFLSTPHCFMEDNRGFFWVPTNKGLFQIARRDLLDYATDTGAMLYYHYYSKEDGFNTNEFNGGCEPAYLKLDNGYASLPSMDGLVVFKPDSIRYFLPDNKLLIESITLDEKPVPCTGRIDLPRSFGQLAIRVSSPYMGHAKNLQLYYALEVDEKRSAWIPVPADGIIRLLMLPVGTHRLIIRQLNGFGITNYTEHTIALYVSPPWYRKAWFYVLVITIIIAGIILFFYLRIRLIQRRNKMLEIAVNNKTRQLLLQTTIQEKIIHSISHDIRTPLRYHKIMAQRMGNNLRETDDLVNLEISGALEDSARRMEYMMDNLVSFLKTQIILEGPSIEPVNIHHLVEEKRLLFQITTAENATSIINRISEKAVIHSNPHLLGIIIQNLLDNAVKATLSGQITISVADSGDEEQVIISDNGNGISSTLKNWLNQAESLSLKSQSVPIHEIGLGLIIISELADLLAIRLQVSSTQGAGTTFTLNFTKQ